KSVARFDLGVSVISNGLANLNQNQIDKALPLLREGFSLIKEDTVHAKAASLEVRRSLALSLRQCGERLVSLGLPGEAEGPLRESLVWYEQGPECGILHADLGACLLALKKYPEAETELLRALEDLKRLDNAGMKTDWTTKTKELLAQLYDALQQPEKAG